MATYVTEYTKPNGKRQQVRMSVSIRTALRMAFRESKGIPVIREQTWGKPKKCA